MARTGREFAGLLMVASVVSLLGSALLVVIRRRRQAE
jgi:LPXTG-motif cell wall-anchored protein